jgi:broad specificity phosphatase PhoE
MVRTHLTAAPLAAARRLQPVELDGIHEVEAGDLEDRSDAVDTYQDVLACWAGGDTEVSIPGGPDGAAFLGRFDASVAAVLRSGAATAVVFSHGASIRPWTGTQAHNLDAAFVRTHRLSNTGLVEMHGDFATVMDVRLVDGRPGGRRGRPPTRRVRPRRSRETGGRVRRDARQRPMLAHGVTRERTILLRPWLPVTDIDVYSRLLGAALANAAGRGVQRRSRLVGG